MRLMVLGLAFGFRGSLELLRWVLEINKVLVSLGTFKKEILTVLRFLVLKVP